jgi:putative aldouronate transport system permease protein
MGGIVMGTLKKKIRPKRSFGDTLISVLTYVFFGAFAFICIYPFYYIFINTISSNVLSQKGLIIFLPHELHIQNYIKAMKIPGLGNAALVSVGRTVIGTALTVVSTAFLGFMFTRESLWHRKFWYRFVIITMYFNAGIIPWFLTMRNLHLTNNFWGYVLPTIVSPFYIILAKTFVESIPKELQQAAEIDGAGTMKVFFSVIMPVIKPIMATVAIFAAVGQWNAFQDTLLLMTNSKLYSLQFILYQYINQASSLKQLVNSSSSSAVAQAVSTVQTATSIRMTVTIIVVAPILLIYPIFQRYFVKGIMIGAVKG